MTNFTPPHPDEGVADNDDTERLARVERIIAAVRIAVVASVAIWLALQPGTVAYPALAWAVIIVAAAYSTAVILWRRWFYGTYRGAWVLTSTDAILTLGVIASTGASRSPAVAILFLVVITAAMRFDIRRALVISVVDSAGYVAVVTLVPRPETDAARTLEAVLWWPFYLLAAAVLTGVLSRLAEYEHELRVRAENAALLARQRAAHLEGLDREREETLRVVVHEFRTPIASLRALARQLAAGGDEARILTPAAVRATRLIQEHADHLADMCDAMRDAISGDGLDAFERGSACDVPLHTVIEAAVSAASAGGAEVKVEVDPPDAIAHVDPARLRRIVTNLVENAIRHNPPDGPPVTVDVRVTGGRAVIVVADHGPGLPDDDSEIALRKGARLGPSSGTQGLGLWMVDRLVYRMGGSLDLGNRREGGLQVVVTLPVLGPTWP